MAKQDQPLQDPKTMAGDALMKEFNQPVTTTGTQEHLDRLASLNAEISRRIVEHAKLLAEIERNRQDKVSAMAHDMTTALYKVWHAHGGRELDSDEISDLAKVMFNFFVDIK